MTVYKETKVTPKFKSYLLQNFEELLGAVDLCLNFGD